MREIDRKSAISLQRGQFDPKISGRRGHPHQMNFSNKSKGTKASEAITYRVTLCRSTHIYQLTNKLDTCKISKHLAVAYIGYYQTEKISSETSISESNQHHYSVKLNQSHCSVIFCSSFSLLILDSCSRLIWLHISFQSYCLSYRVVPYLFLSL